MFEIEHRIQTGTGHSDFQARPEPFRERPVTDWEKAFTDTKKGLGNKIRGDISDIPDFYRDYPKHIDHCADDLHNRIFRMSLDFGRLCPKKGEFDEEQMGQYIRIIAYCRKKNLDPLVTLHHWPLPLSYCQFSNEKMQAGGWEHPEILDHFRFYIEKVIEYFVHPDKIRAALNIQDTSGNSFSSEEIDSIINEGILCKSFITINEPMMHHLLPYLLGDFPPYKLLRFDIAQKVLNKLGEANSIAHDALHTIKTATPDIQHIHDQVRSGIAYNFIKFEGLFKKWIDQYLNWNTVETVEREGKLSDFVGIQYYSALDITMSELGRRITGKNPKGREFGDHPGFGALDPSGIKEFLMEVHKRYPDKRLMVSEFGFADKKDLKKPYLIMKTVEMILEAQKEGAKVDTIILWALINNLEWSEGMSVPFGLYDQHANPLPTDSETQTSSRNVWSTLSQYFNDPDNPAYKQAVLKMYDEAKAQYEQASLTRS